MKILVLGSHGQLGRCLKDQFSNLKFDIVFASRKEIDLSNFKQTNITILDINPDIIINAAAYTHVDKAETDIETATIVNETAVANLASICKKINSWLIHISTDYLFDGNANIPYKESDKTNPQCVYGKSKLDGELAIRKSNCKYLIIRTAWVFSEYGNNFVKTMMNLTESHKEVRVVGDQFGSPTYAQDLAKAIIHTFKFLENDRIIGTYHYAGNHSCSWSDFAKFIFDEAFLAKHLKYKPTVKVITSSEYPTPVKRPAYSVLDTSKFESTFNFKSSDWSKGVVKVIGSLNKDKKNM